MRDSITLWELESILDDVYNHEPELVDFIREAVAKAVLTCLCAAHSENECLCGAWEGE